MNVPHSTLHHKAFQNALKVHYLQHQDVKLAKDFDGKEIAELIICDVNNERRSNIIENLKQIEEKNKEIEQINSLELVKEYMKNGDTKKDAIKKVAKLKGVNKDVVYKECLDI